MAAVRAGITAFNVTTPRLFLAAMVLALAACGGGGSGGGSGPQSATSSTVSPDTNSQAASLPTAVTSTAPTSAAAPTAGLVALPATLANTTTAGNQTLRTVAALADGGHALAWLSQDAAGVASFYLQRFDAQGAKSGAETRVAYEIGTQETPAITVLPNGNAVVASVAARAVPGADPSTVNWTVFARRFDVNGAPLGGETVVATLLENQAGATVRRYLAQPTLLALDDGNFVAGWASVEQDYRGKVQALHLQRYDGSGQAAGAPVDFAAMGIDRNLALKLAAAPGGNYVAGTTHRFMGQAWVVYRIGGHDVGPTFNADSGLPESGTTLVSMADGRYALWSTGGTGAYLQMLDAAGHVTAPAVMLARLPETAVGLADGGYATLVREALEGPVLAQRFDSAGASVGPAIALDTGYARSSAVMLTGGGAGFALAWTRAGTQDSDVMTQHVNETP
jgi:hypothetical protein